MKKVYLSIIKGVEGELARPLLEKLILAKGHSLTDVYQSADIIFKHVDKDKAELYANKENTVLFYINDIGQPVFLKTSKSKMIPKTVKVSKSVDMEYKETDLSFDREAINILYYLTGKTPNCKINRVMRIETLFLLQEIAGTMTARSQFIEKKKIKYMQLLNMSEEELVRASNMVLGVTSYEENKLTRLLRKVSYFFYKPNNKVIPNSADNIFVNLLTICKFRIYKENTTDEEKVKRFDDMIEKAYNSTIKSIKESLTGSTAFKKYAKKSHRQMGVYSIFICDNSLEDNEVMIPHPNSLGVSRKNYPKIGDNVLDVRHPITTLIGNMKVKGYTDDCSIRTNSFIALCLYGDADGDAHSISWSDFSSSLKWDEEKEFKDFGKSAGIELKDSNFVFTNEMWNELQSAKLPSDEECLKKSSESGLEQASAKLVTKSVTGIFGATERDVAQTLICNKKTPTMLMLHRKSWLSQIPVQAKNLLSDLRSGKELDDLTKETLKLYCEMQERELNAITGIKNLLDVDNKGALRIINDLYGREEKVTIKKDDNEEELLKKIASSIF